MEFSKLVSARAIRARDFFCSGPHEEKIGDERARGPRFRAWARTGGLADRRRASRHRRIRRRSPAGRDDRKTAVGAGPQSGQSALEPEASQKIISFTPCFSPTTGLRLLHASNVNRRRSAPISARPGAGVSRQRAQKENGLRGAYGRAGTRSYGREGPMVKKAKGESSVKTANSAANRERFSDARELSRNAPRQLIARPPPDTR